MEDPTKRTCMENQETKRRSSDSSLGARSSLTHAVQSCLANISDTRLSTSGILSTPSESKKDMLMVNVTSMSGSPSSARLTPSIQDFSTSLSRLRRITVDQHFTATFDEENESEPVEYRIMCELTNTYASMMELYLHRLLGPRSSTQRQEIFARNTEIALNGLTTLQSALCQIPSTPFNFPTTKPSQPREEPTRNATSGSTDLLMRARPSGLKRTFTDSKTTGLEVPCIRTTTTTENKSSSTTTSSRKPKTFFQSPTHQSGNDQSQDKPDTPSGSSQEDSSH